MPKTDVMETAGSPDATRSGLAQDGPGLISAGVAGQSLVPTAHRARGRRGALAVLVIATLLGSSACTGGAASTGRADTLPEETPSSESLSDAPTDVPPVFELPTKAETKAAVLGLEDMPSGYSPEKNTDTSDKSTVIAGAAACRKVFGRAVAAGNAPRSALAAYSAGELGPFVFSGVAVYKSKDEAVKQLAGMRKFFSGCRKWTERDENGAVSHLTAKALSAGKHGDETFAVRLSVEGEAYHLTADFAFVRIASGLAGTYTASVTSIFGNSGKAPNLDKLVKKASAKLETVV